MLEGEHPRLIDFDMAYVFKDKEGARVKEFEKKGTKGYAAPEIYEEEGYYGDEIDVFSLGVVLFWLVMRRRPFEEGSLRCQSYRDFLQDKNGFWEGIKGEEFKDLVNKMCSLNYQRIKINLIKIHPFL